MGFGDIFQSLFWGRRDLGLVMPPVRRPPRPRRPGRSTPPYVGQRVCLRQPIASAHKVWINEGAAGVVVGGDARARQVSIELDTPRTVITVPWTWIEEEEAETPSPNPDAAGTGSPPPSPGA
jgi:hypothetical protein